MSKRLFLICIFTYLVVGVFAQKNVRIQLEIHQSTVPQKALIENTNDNLKFKESLSFIDLKEIDTKQGKYLQLSSEKTFKSFDKGNPNLPLITKLIEIPINVKPIVRIVNFDEQIIDLKEYNLENKIIPAQPSMSKSEDPEKRPFYKNKEVYATDDFFKNDIVRIEDKGYMRNKHIVYLEVSPFQYNPVTNKVRVLNNIEYEISYEKESKSVVNNVKKLESPYFNNIVKTANAQDSKAIITGPAKYVIVSDPMFKTTLQPFVEWKTMKGFNVIEAYTDDANVGTTTTSIKAYLQDLYENPSDGVSPTFVLFVGDVDQIPAFTGEYYVQSSYHPTDLYYVEYTGDMLPEVFYGRFSATTEAQLQSQIDKTLYLEKYQITDASYLNNVVLVAGVDDDYAPEYGNGFVNYANKYYTNIDNGITSYYYLYGDDSGVMSSNNPAASESMQSYINAGVSIANYTAHCSPSGWSDPNFSNSDVGLMTNANMYPLLIGNCCESARFHLESFGEEVLRAANKGAVGYIGTTDFSYWDEDFYWGVGLSKISSNPTYENSGLGAYDRFFHSNNEDKDDWYITQGQMVFAGNLEVEASTSNKKEYYWEIYHLMGDPSLTPYVTVPSVMVANYNSEIIENSTSFQVVSEGDSYVALSQDGMLLDAKYVNESGVVDLNFDAISGTGKVDIVITKQNRQPVIDEIDIVPDNKPNVYVKTITISDALGNNNGEIDYGESVTLHVLLENGSETFNAQNVIVNFTSLDTNVVIVDNTETFGTVNAQGTKEIESAIALNFKNRFADMQKVEFDIELQWQSESKTEYTATSKYNVLVNAPELKITNFIIDDENGNKDGILDPGENVKFKVDVENKGGASISDVYVEIGDITGTSYLTIDPKSNKADLVAGESKTLEFNVALDQEETSIVPVQLDFTAKEDLFNYYTNSLSKQAILGEVREFKVSDEGTNIIRNKGALFYDTGGKSNSYFDDEDYVITFLPDDENSKITAKFLSFSVEYHSSCAYDYLSVYDSSIVNESALIGTYCGTNSPGEIEATNTEGALSFKFHSDAYTRGSGWEAEIAQVGTYTVTFNITDKNDSPIQDVNVTVNSKSSNSNSKGVAVLYNVVPGTEIGYTLSKTGYENYTGVFDIKDQDIEVNAKMALVNSIDDIGKRKFSVYPNPSNGIFNIEFPNFNMNELVSIKIYNVLGSVVFSRELRIQSNASEQIDISNQAKGMYILSIESENAKNATKRIIIR